MATPVTALEATQEGTTEELIERARKLIPNIRARALESERMRRLHDETAAEIEAAGLLQVLVPRKWGGYGADLRAVCEIARVLAQGDASAAWTTSFLIEHNWMVCHLPMETQRQLYHDRPYLRVAAPLQPQGHAERVPGGFRVTGKWRYASGVDQSDWLLCTSAVEDGGAKIPHSFLIPLESLTVHDEWFMSGMCATCSTNVSGEEVFVPDSRALETEIFHSADRHPGATHVESIYRYPILSGLYVMMAALALGCAEAALQLGRARLSESAPWGLKRIDRAESRIRWGWAAQKVRCAQLLYQDVLQTVIAKCDAQEAWTLEEEGQLAFDRITVVHLSKEAIRMICDGSGSSTYQLNDPLQRYLRDIDVIANHLGNDMDATSERCSRWILGLGRNATDPFPPRASRGDDTRAG